MVPNVRVDCRCLTLFVMALAGVGCRVDGPTASGPPVVLERVSGDGQRARPGEPLERPLVARLLDAEGRPVRRVEVRWTVTAGEVKPRLSATDASGEARATWTPGTVAGAQRAVASADGLPPIEFTAVVDPDAVPDRIPLQALAVDTYDGSNQVVHPDVALSSLSGADDVPRLIITPYPWGNASFENPSLYEGNGREVWFAPATVTNPIVKPTRGYLSDPDLVSVPDGAGALWLYSRRVDGENEILLTQSADGVRWSAPRVVVRVPSHEAVSPTIVRRSATDWLMWTVNSGPAGCGSASTTVELRRSTDGIMWSPPTTTMLSQGGVFAWHLEVQWIPTRGEYWALFNGKVAGSCTTEALYVATSGDGITWRTYQSPVLRRGAIPEFEDVVYRSTFAYDADRDLVSLWYSGARSTSRGYEWHAAFERRTRTDLFDGVARSDVALIAPSTAPPLTNATAP